MALVLGGCTTHNVPLETDGCKMRTYSNLGLPDYIKARFNYRQPIRIAIIPFEVPANFAPNFGSTGQENLNFGRELARKFQLELRRSGELAIVEVFNRDRWPGKREEFFTGNYNAIRIAKDAGYHMVMVGFLEQPKNDEDLNLHTKIIDTTNGVTVWDAKTMAFSRNRSIEKGLSQVFIGHERPEQFYFPERTERMVVCTVDKILTGDPVPQ